MVACCYILINFAVGHFDQGCGDVVKMAQPLLWRSSFHKHGSGALFFHSMSPALALASVIVFTH